MIVIMEATSLVRDQLNVTNTVSVVISTYAIERHDLVSKCIASLRAQTLPAHEIILVLEPDKKLLLHYQGEDTKDVKIVISGERGLSSARNAGVATSHGAIIAFIDDDAIAEEEWLENLMRDFDDPTVIGVGGAIIPMWEETRPKWFPEELDWTVGCTYKGLPLVKAVVKNPLGCNMAFRRSAFERAGQFDTRVGRLGQVLLASEEAEFARRLLSLTPKSRILHDPSLVVHHRVPKSRTTLSHVLLRSFYEGVSKSILQRNSSFKTPLSVERNYLRDLLVISIPQRLRRISHLTSILQLSSILLSTLAVFAGYCYGYCIRTGLSEAPIDENHFSSKAESILEAVV